MRDKLQVVDLRKCPITDLTNQQLSGRIHKVQDCIRAQEKELLENKKILKALTEALYQKV